MSNRTDDIIIVRTSDPDGRIFKEILKTLEHYNREIISIENLSNQELSFPGLKIYTNSGVVLRGEKPVQLNYGEFSVLCYLARHPRLIFSKEKIYSAVYGEDHYNSNTVQSIICRLRRKIETDPRHPIYIKTVIGLGYKFDPP